MAERYRLQQIKDFVVQIRHTSTDAIVGTGFVAREGIVTCAHVVRDAGVDPRTRDGLDVSIYYPEREGRLSIKKRAKVAACFDQYDDDVVLLHLVDGSSPLGPELAAIFGSAKGSEDHDFRSFGYRRLQNYQGFPAFGKIVGHGEKPRDKKFQGEPLMLSSQNIDKGMSGAPVLDTSRDLIIGIIYLAWDSAEGSHDRDTGLSVDARVLSLEPLCLALEENDLPRSSSPSPKIDQQKARESVAIRQKIIWNNAPPSLAEWTGRKQLLEEITTDWEDANVRVTGLVGFGGEGKSSLAREWVDQLLADSSRPQPEGVFWWGFYERRNVDEFFDAALNYMSGGKIDVKKIPSANMKAQVIAAMLGAGRYLFVLDGLEVLQYQDGDMYGAIRSPDLKAFLEFFASPDHNSFCIVTTRVPLMDLEEFITFQHRDVERLLPEDGRDLLRKLGVQGADDELDRVVADWDGHALTLSLLGSYLKDHHAGDVGQIRNIPRPNADEPRYERIHRVLRRYDEHLQEAEKAFLMLFSAFRRPVDKDAFRIFRAKSEKQSSALNDPIATLNDSQFEAMVQRLVDYRILRQLPRSNQYTTHPLIRDHYFTLLTMGRRGQAEEAHKQIKDYYLDKAQGMPDKPSLDDLTPLIEVVHHACECGAYDEAYTIRDERIHRRSERYIIHKLGAWETQLEIMREFFLGGDTSQEPLVSSPEAKAWILNSVGLCLDVTGRGNLADPFYERALSIALESGDWANASRGYQNLSSLYYCRGDLARSCYTAGQALDLARRAGKKDLEFLSLAPQAWAYHLQGNLKKASRNFRDAEALEKENDSSISHLSGLRGIHHADHLMRRGEADYARKVTQANLKICERYNFPAIMSQCHRILADLFADAGQHEEARESYGLALNLARSISHRLVLIEALLSRGRWYGKIMKDSAAASSDLNEALEYARAGGYRPYEADIRIGLAWAHLAAGNVDLARGEARFALQMSQDMGYHWGIVDAKEVLAKLDQS